MILESKIRWPETMPILNGHDMCIGMMTSRCGKRHCLWGHSATLQKKKVISKVVESAVDDAVKEAITECGYLSDSPLSNFVSIVSFNDTHRCADNAKIWNRAMYLLGYTEGNPQSKPVKLKE
jgi:hypothetical protein